MAEISQIKLPNGVTYDIKDAAAREAIAAGIEIVVVTELPTASASTMGKLYFVNHSHGTGDVYDEYVTVKSGSAAPYTYSWEKIGNTDIDLSNYSLNTHYHTITRSTKYLHKGSVPATFGTAKALTGVTKQKLTQTTVTGVNGSTSVTGVSGSTTASKATAGTAVAVAKIGTAVSVPNVTGNDSASVTVTPSTANRATGTLGNETNTQAADTVMWGASVSSEVLSFSFKPMNTADTVTGIASATTDATKTTLGTALSITPAVSNGNITPYTFTDVTVPVAAASATTVPVAASESTTVATGEVGSTGNGAEVATGTTDANFYNSVATTKDVYDTINTTASGGDAFVESVNENTSAAVAAS